MKTRDLNAAFVGAPIRRTAELYRLGWTAYFLRLALESGELERIRRGVFALPGTALDIVEAAKHGGMLCCVSAARQQGLWVLDDSQLHVAVGYRDRVHPHPGCRCRTHRVDTARLGHRALLVQALAQVLDCQGEEGFFVALESALRQRKLDGKALRRLRASIPAHRQHLIDEARSDADSGLESLLRFRLLPYGIELRSQVEVPGVGRVDFVLGDRLILEVDGKPNHDGPSMRHKDLVRDAIAAGLGFETLRFDYALVVHDWLTVLGAILARVDAGRHLTPTR